jgi:hypothetical protein
MSFIVKPADAAARATSDLDQVRAELRTLVLQRRNGDGGWPYATGKASRLEPTSWALLALAASAGGADDEGVLRRWPRSQGWLVDVKGAPVNIAFNALAALTMLSTPAHRPMADPVVRLVVATKGMRLEQSPDIRQDASLQAWGWVDGTFSWVEPTALAVLLLKKAASMTHGAEARERIRTGERMLLDRSCRDGGWNYGNSNVFGQDLWPYVPTTALALLALQDRSNDPIVAKSLHRMREDLSSEQSLLSMGLAVLAFGAHGVSTETLVRDLADRSRSGPHESIGTVALATTLYALSTNHGGGGAFTI